jgi:TRAP-type C4-dicarboxylate transport system permease small subunit
LRAPLWVFLVCCALTLGASFGQIGTIFLLSRDALGPDPPVALPQLVGAVYILLCILAFLVVFRSAIDLPMLIRQHSDPLPPKDEEAARAARRWSLL